MLVCRLCVVFTSENMVDTLNGKKCYPRNVQQNDIQNWILFLNRRSFTAKSHCEISPHLNLRCRCRARRGSPPRHESSAAQLSGPAPASAPSHRRRARRGPHRGTRVQQLRSAVAQSPLTVQHGVSPVTEALEGVHSRRHAMLLLLEEYVSSAREHRVDFLLSLGS